MTDDEVPVEARRNEYANLTDGELQLVADEAEEANDWQTLSKLQVANLPSGALPGGMTLKVQGDFIDRR